MPLVDLTAWDEFIHRHPDSHLLQTGGWGELKNRFGWLATRLVTGKGESDLGAQILFKQLPLGMRMAYLPKGPVTSATVEDIYRSWSPLWPEVDALCRRQRAIFLKVEPDMWQTPGQAWTASPPPGFQHSFQTVQPPRTLVIDLRGDEEQVLERMKQKTRYNIRLALKKNIVVYPSGDLETFYRIMQVTGERDNFGVHSLEYYRVVYDIFHPLDACELFIAEYEGVPLAGLFAFARGSRAWYLYGASTNDQRDRMPTYLLQWEAMRWARSKGCIEYDLWGVPDADEEVLEAEFTSHTTGLWGVYRFKRGFGGELRRAAGPWDRVYSKSLYSLYQIWSKRRRIVI